MSLHAVLLFVPICFALNMTFGPSNLLSMTNGARAGIGFAALAGIGRLIAYGPMMAVSAAGLGVLLATSAVAFHVVKFLGAAYLIWLGIKLLRTPPATGVAALALMRPTRAAGFRQETVTDTIWQITESVVTLIKLILAYFNPFNLFDEQKRAERAKAIQSQLGLFDQVRSSLPTSDADLDWADFFANQERR